MLKQQKNDYPLYISGDFNQVDSAFSDLWNDLLIHAKVTDIQPNLSTFEGPNGHSALDRILCPTEYIAAAQVDVLVATHRRHHLSGHYQLTATFLVRPCVKSNMKDPIHQTILSDVFCPGRTEADTYAVPNDLQELIRRIQRLKDADDVDFVATLWSWWRHQPIPSMHPRVPNHELLRKFLRIRAEVLHIPIKQYQSLQAVTYHVFSSHPAPEIQTGQAKLVCGATSSNRCLTFMTKFQSLVITRALNKPISKLEVSGAISAFGTDFAQSAQKELRTMAQY